MGLTVAPTFPTVTIADGPTLTVAAAAQVAVSDTTTSARAELNMRDYGAVGDGTHDDGPALAAMLADMETTGHTGFIPPGTYKLTTGLPVLLNSATNNFTYVIRGAGKATILKPTGLTSAFIFHCNYAADGTTVVDSTNLLHHPRVVFEDLLVDGANSTSAGLMKIYARSFTMRRVYLDSLLYGVLEDGYTDHVRLEQVHASSLVSGGFAYKQQYHGDGLVVDGLFAYGSGGLSLNRCAGAVINGRISGWDEFLRCQAIQYNGAHLEGDGTTPPTASIYVAGSEITINDSYFYTLAGVPVIQIEDDTNASYRQKSSVTLDGCRFARVISSATTTHGTAVHFKNFSGYSRFITRNSYAVTFTNNGGTRWVFDPFGYKTAADDATIQTAITNNPDLLTQQAELRRTDTTWEFVPITHQNARTSRTTPNGISMTSITSNTTYPSNLAAGTYYYVATLRHLGFETAKSSELSRTATLNQSVQLNIATRFAPVTLRLWRGTSSGTYDRYVDLLVAQENNEIYDTGAGVSGFAWITTGVPTPPTSSSILDGIHVGGGGRRLLFGTAQPTVGAYTRGDILFYTGASAGGKIGAVCVTGGTPGTWKDFGAIDA